MSITAYQLPSSKKTIYVVLGHGLIGSAVAFRLSKLGNRVNTKNKPNMSWESALSICGVIEFLVKALASNKLHLIWCAGKAGFLSTDQELEKEFNVFQEVINNIACSYKDFSVTFMSSAGGIYENTSRVTHLHTNICPTRPYTKWKLKQEKFIKETINNYQIYRLSSVYGSITGNARRGMISALIDSAYTNTTALIYAKSTTLRDYISNEDIAKYVVSQLSQKESSIKILASARPTSIDMLTNMVAIMTKRKPKVIYQPEIYNDKDIVFTKSCLPPDLSTCSLEEGVQKISSLYLINKNR